MAKHGGVVAVLAAMFLLLVFAGDGVLGHFASDDMMNLYGSWVRAPLDLLKSNVLFYGGAYRPLGALFYAPLFHLFGFNALPYHLICFALLLANLAVLFGFIQALTGSRDCAVLAVLLGAYHARLADLYYNVDTVYDLLCFFFYFGVLLWYIKIRNSDKEPGAGQSLLLCVMLVCALNAKEIAASLPVFVLLFELIYRKKRSVRFLLPAGAIVIASISGKFAGAERLTNNPAYALHPTPAAWASSAGHYLGELACNAFPSNEWTAVLVCALAAAGALAAWQRDMIVGWIMAMLTALPVMLIEPRGLYALYVASPFVLLYLSRLLVMARGRLRQWALLVLVMAALLPFHWKHRNDLRNNILEDQRRTRALPTQLAEQHVTLPKGGRVLFLTDPYDGGDFILTSTLRLYYRDETLRVDRTKVMPPEGRYDRVFEFADWRLKERANQP